MPMWHIGRITVLAESNASIGRWTPSPVSSNTVILLEVEFPPCCSKFLLSFVVSVAVRVLQGRIASPTPNPPPFSSGLGTGNGGVLPT